MAWQEIWSAFMKAEDRANVLSNLPDVTWTSASLTFYAVKVQTLANVFSLRCSLISKFTNLKVKYELANSSSMSLPKSKCSLEVCSRHLSPFTLSFSGLIFPCSKTNTSIVASLLWKIFCGTEIKSWYWEERLKWSVRFGCSKQYKIHCRKHFHQWLSITATWNEQGWVQVSQTRTF